jgi:transcription elongation factor Elf1
MPDRGIWTLQCQSCGERFTLEVLPGEHLVEYVKSYVCPHCKKNPDQLSKVKDSGSWHHVVDFHAKAR